MSKYMYGHICKHKYLYDDCTHIIQIYVSITYIIICKHVIYVIHHGDITEDSITIWAKIRPYNPITGMTRIPLTMLARIATPQEYTSHTYTTHHVGGAGWVAEQFEFEAFIWPGHGGRIGRRKLGGGMNQAFGDG
jgi:hypothetical protein